MSQYANQADVEKQLSLEELVQLTDFKTRGKFDVNILDDAAKRASATIDAYAQGRYGLPLVVSDQVRNVAVKLTIYELEMGRHMVREDTRNDYEWAIRFLEGVADGDVSLNQPTLTQTVSAAMGVKTRDHDDDPEVFDDTRIDGYIDGE